MRVKSIVRLVAPLNFIASVDDSIPMECLCECVRARACARVRAFVSLI